MRPIRIKLDVGWWVVTDRLFPGAVWFFSTRDAAFRFARDMWKSCERF